MVKMALASGFTKEEALDRLGQLSPEFSKVIEEVYGSRTVESAQREVLAGLDEVEPLIDRGSGQNVDGNGLDEADRAMLAFLHALNEDDD